MDAQFQVLYCNALVCHEANLYILYFKTINYQTRIEKLRIKNDALIRNFQALSDLINLEIDKVGAELKRHDTEVQKDLFYVRKTSTLKHQRISTLSLNQIVRELADDLFQINEGVHKVDVYRTLIDSEHQQDSTFIDILQDLVDSVIWGIQRTGWQQKKNWVQLERQYLIQV